MKNNTPNIAPLPIGESDIKKLILSGFTYVDKTDLIYNMIRYPAKYFLSRPRRFGKSTLISTLYEIFNGNKELFKDQWIYNSAWTWDKYPIIKLDFNISRTSDLETYIIKQLKRVAKDHSIEDLLEFDDKNNSYDLLFRNLIIELYKKYNQYVVILIDEYDKPILDAIGLTKQNNEDNQSNENSEEKQNNEDRKHNKDNQYSHQVNDVNSQTYQLNNQPNIHTSSQLNIHTNNQLDNKNIVDAMHKREILKGFYGVMKGVDEYIRFIILTGVSKFSKVGIFSGLNNLNDISMDSKYASLCGITEEELEYYYKDYIIKLASVQNISYNDCVLKIRHWYNGFYFSEDMQTSVYNPFSTLCLLEHKKFKNYWFVTGSPSFLIKLIKQQNNIQLEQYDHIMVTQSDFDSFEIDQLKLLALLFQTGYLTIKEYNESLDRYTLSYPNLEIEKSFKESLLTGFNKQENNNSNSLFQIVELLNLNTNIFNANIVNRNKNTNTNPNPKLISKNTVNVGSKTINIKRSTINPSINLINDATSINQNTINDINPTNDANSINPSINPRAINANTNQAYEHLGQVITILKQIFLNIDYDIKISQEQHYQNIIYLIFQLLGFMIKTEYKTNMGRIDIIMETDHSIYIFEFKLDKTALDAINQIHEKQYYARFLSTDKKIYLLGINFSSVSRNIDDYIIEAIN